MKSLKSVKHHKVIGIHDDTRHRIDFSYGDISISDTDTSEHLDLSSSSSESVEDVAGIADDRMDDGERDDEERLSLYEIERLQRIAENKRKFIKEIFGESLESGKNAKKPRKVIFIC